MIIEATAYLKNIANPTDAPAFQAILVVGPIKPNKIPATSAKITPNMNIF